MWCPFLSCFYVVVMSVCSISRHGYFSFYWTRECLSCMQITLAKHKGDILGLMVIDSGYGSAIPSCIVAHMSKTGAAIHSGLLNVGDYILSINGVSLVGMPIKTIIEQIKVRWVGETGQSWLRRLCMCVCVLGW